jgi:hypothetical protein
MTQVDLLDPRASDRFLRAYALLASEYAAGAKSAIDSLLPFIKRAVEHFQGQQFDARLISKYVEQTYRVRAPIYMMDAFKYKLIEGGYIEKPTNIPQVLICRCVDRKLHEDELAIALSPMDLQGFESSLTEYAAAQGLTKPYASENWSEALIKFFAGWDDRKSATVDRQLIFDSKRLDDRIISKFIASLDHNSFNYEICKKLYYGVIVADFFTCISEISSTDSLRSVAVILDTTLLMRLLGTSGELLKEATEELVRDVQLLGGTAYYFAHTYEELIESLEALAHQIGNRLEMNRESAHALAAGETSLGKIQMFSREADIRLGELGITQHEAIYKRGDNRYQIDEEGFVKAIGGSRSADHRVRWERDAKSLALVIRVRQEKRTRQLRECVAIFVTHNGALARAAREFLEFSSFEVPPVLTTDQVSVMAWLERGGGINDQELSAKLAAACYEAVIPREGWEAQFWKKLEELKQSDQYRDLLNSQILTNSMRATVLDKTFGEPSLARQLELGPILKDLAEQAEVERRENRLLGIQEGQQNAIAAFEQRLLAKSERFAQRATNVLLAVVLVAILVLYLVPAVKMVLNPDERGAPYYLNAAFALLLSLVTLLALFDITPTIKRARGMLEALFASLFLRVTRWLV